MKGGEGAAVGAVGDVGTDDDVERLVDLRYVRCSDLDLNPPRSEWCPTSMS